MEFYINLNGADSLHSQIAKQIEYRIAVGELLVGDRLPTIRELEARLGVNRHTVRRAYLDLEKRGLITVRRGKGATVAMGISIAEGRQDDPVVEDLMESTLNQARKLGYAPLQFLAMLKPRALGLDRRCPSIAVAECSADQAQDLALALEATLGQHVVGINLRETIHGTSPVPKSVRYMVVPIFHSDEAQRLFAKRKIEIITVHVRLSRQLQQAAAKLHPVKRPCLVLRDEDSLSLLSNVVRQTLGLNKVRTILSNDLALLQRIIRWSDLVMYTSPCRRVLEDMVPKGKKRLEITYEFTTDSIDLIRTFIMR